MHYLKCTDNEQTLCHQCLLFLGLCKKISPSHRVIHSNTNQTFLGSIHIYVYNKYKDYNIVLCLCVRAFMRACLKACVHCITFSITGANSHK